MKHIGEKIKELRRKNDMTQEKLADYLNVTYQTVSKWETGITNPDLSLIVPLARLFKVTTDELLGMEEAISDARRLELEKQYDETTKASGDVKKRYEIAKTAVEEYPGDFNYLYWLANAKDSYGLHLCEKGSDEQKNSMQMLRSIINL